MNPVFPFKLSEGRVSSRDITLDRTQSITLMESINYNMYLIDILTLYSNHTQ